MKSIGIFIIVMAFLALAFIFIVTLAKDRKMKETTVQHLENSENNEGGNIIFTERDYSKTYEGGNVFIKEAK